jgi:hypothetical protein
MECKSCRIYLTTSYTGLCVYCSNESAPCLNPGPDDASNTIHCDNCCEVTDKLKDSEDEYNISSDECD